MDLFEGLAPHPSLGVKGNPCTAGATLAAREGPPSPMALDYLQVLPAQPIRNISESAPELSATLIGN